MQGIHTSKVPARQQAGVPIDIPVEFDHVDPIEEFGHRRLWEILAHCKAPQLGFQEHS